MSAGFTRGPWVARRSLIHVEGKGTLATVSNPWDSEHEREANARLIAAAPALYDALEAICNLSNYDDVRDAKGIAVAALKLARGEEA